MGLIAAAQMLGPLRVLSTAAGRELDDTVASYLLKGHVSIIVQAARGLGVKHSKRVCVWTPCVALCSHRACIVFICDFLFVRNEQPVYRFCEVSVEDATSSCVGKYGPRGVKNDATPYDAFDDTHASVTFSHFFEVPCR